MTDSEDELEKMWRIGVFDAHCHPVEVMASVKDIAQMRARGLTVMSTRAQDQQLTEDAAHMYPLDPNRDFLPSRSGSVIPAFGWHPWFSHQLYDDRETDTDTDTNASRNAVDHYKSVLVPSPDDRQFLESLPPPTSLRAFIQDTESRLRSFPVALVGEVGLDRSFRLPDSLSAPTADKATQELTPGSREGRPLSPYRVNMVHQKSILRAQLKLAAQYQRPVSVHSVQAHGLVFELVQQMWKGHERPSRRERRRKNSVPNAHVDDNEDKDKDDNGRAKAAATPLPFPPRLCMHSYSGPPDALKQFLSPNIPLDVYFSFSTVINFSASSSDKVTRVIQTVPDDRLLTESDLHCAGQTMDDMLKDITMKICEIKGWALLEGTQRLRENWVRFIFG